MLTYDGFQEYLKYQKYISDDEYMLSPNFVPDENTPQEAIDYYKGIYEDFFPGQEITFPTGIGFNL